MRRISARLKKNLLAGRLVAFPNLLIGWFKANLLSSHTSSRVPVERIDKSANQPSTASNHAAPQHD
jgi:hypothetical protein